jgi:hypothetical protein
MNEFISPHQNININVSYTLNRHEKSAPKIVFTKKTNKNLKLPSKDSPESFDKTIKKITVPTNAEHKRERSHKNGKPKKRVNNTLIPEQ